MATALRHDLEADMRALGERARSAARILAMAPRAAKDRALQAAAVALRARREEILAKFRKAAKGLLPHDNTERVIEMIVGIADLPNVADLCAVLAQPAHA